MGVPETCSGGDLHVRKAKNIQRSFRGHDETTDSENQGNIIECMELLKQFDLFLQTYAPIKHSIPLKGQSERDDRVLFKRSY